MSETHDSGANPGLGRVAARGAVTILSGQAVRITVQLAGVVIMARLLGPSDYGVVAMVTALIGIGEIFRDFGLASAAIQAKVLTPAQKDNLFWVNSGIGLLLCIIVFSLAPLIANFYDDQRLVLVAMVLSSTFLLNGIVTQFRADLNRKMNFRRLTIAEVSAQALALGLGIYLASIGWGYWALVTQQVSQLVLLLGILIIVTPWFPHFWHPKESIRPFLSFGANIVGAQLLNYASRNTDSVVLGATLGAGPVGLYNRAFQLMLLPLNQLNGPSTRVALPVLSRLDGNKPRYDAFILLGQTVMLHLVSGVFALLGAQAYAIIYIALGETWLESVPVFQILLIAGFFQTAGYAANWVYLSKGLTRANLRFSLIARPIMIVIIVIGGFWGLYGVAGAYAFASALIWPFSLWWVARSSDAPARGLFFNGMRTISAYGFATFVSYLSTAFLPEDQLILRIVVGIAALLGALGLLALLWPAFRRDLKAIAGARSLLRSARKPAGDTSKNAGTDGKNDTDAKNDTDPDTAPDTAPDTKETP